VNANDSILTFFSIMFPVLFGMWFLAYKITHHENRIGRGNYRAMSYSGNNSRNNTNNGRSTRRVYNIDSRNPYNPENEEKYDGVIGYDPNFGNTNTITIYQRLQDAQEAEDAKFQDNMEYLSNDAFECPLYIPNGMPNDQIIYQRVQVEDFGCESDSEAEEGNEADSGYRIPVYQDWSRDVNQAGREAEVRYAMEHGLEVPVWDK